MTETLNPAVAASYTADDIKRMLVAGRTVAETANRSHWPRQRVTAVANGVKGWMLDPSTDKVYQPGNAGMAPRLPDGIDPNDARPADDDLDPAPEPRRPDQVSDLGIELKQPAALLALIARLLGMLSGYDDPAAAKDIAKARDALTRLEDSLTLGNRRRQAEADLAAAEQAVAAAKERLRGLKTSKAPAPKPASPPAGGPTPAQVRAWAAEHGIECAVNGKIPAAVRQQYDAAHNQEGTPTT